jgi:hypothetical protein
MLLDHGGLDGREIALDELDDGVILDASGHGVFPAAE